MNLLRPLIICSFFVSSKYAFSLPVCLKAGADVFGDVGGITFVVSDMPFDTLPRVNNYVNTHLLTDVLIPVVGVVRDLQFNIFNTKRSPNDPQGTKFDKIQLSIRLGQKTIELNPGFAREVPAEGATPEAMASYAEALRRDLIISLVEPNLIRTFIALQASVKLDLRDQIVLPTNLHTLRTAVADLRYLCNNYYDMPNGRVFGSMLQQHGLQEFNETGAYRGGSTMHFEMTLSSYKGKEDYAAIVRERIESKLKQIKSEYRDLQVFEGLGDRSLNKQAARIVMEFKVELDQALFLAAREVELVLIDYLTLFGSQNQQNKLQPFLRAVDISGMQIAGAPRSRLTNSVERLHGKVRSLVAGPPERTARAIEMFFYRAVVALNSNLALALQQRVPKSSEAVIRALKNLSDPTVDPNVVKELEGMRDKLKQFFGDEPAFLKVVDKEFAEAIRTTSI